MLWGLCRTSSVKSIVEIQLLLEIGEFGDRQVGGGRGRSAYGFLLQFLSSTTALGFATCA